ncbi:hypothetical protein Clacol_010612 [Clathrus columnatus]|uniref:DyP dimeric alpha+beta barrel domain-containing protein n=1 Tax=Clathrus columnatus TaxID=1419009 RepID=A0AAV5A439_9AGAM|nr:hypothetical protein Clacol_003252 [Clathrus columnatus]GJJ16315.1 hypothetical protein Clacol_010612 [Clathrus columnatus]
MRSFSILLHALCPTIIISSAHAAQQKRQESPGLLINPPGFFPLPTPHAPRPEPLISSQPQSEQFTLNLSNIQGDILISPSAVNIAFSNSGLELLLGVTNLTASGDPFAAGQASDAFNLGDPSPIQNNWIPGFVDTAALHGVFLIGAQNTSLANDVLDQIISYLNDSIVEIYSLQASARPGDKEGHEHFGYLDGISQPGISGFTTNPVNGQVVIPPGIILLGEEGDPVVRPEWAQDGSFLVFRQMQQLVPEFDTFLTNNALMIPEITTLEEGRDLLGARMMGRANRAFPLSDNLTLAADPNLNNDFNYTLTDDNSLCPFASHIRKSYPRSDLDETTVDNLHRIMRASTPYGPEVTAEETASNTTTFDRGLAFGDLWL